MRRKGYKHHIEILPAALLPRKREWQGVARSLPGSACLLVTNPEKQQQTKLLLELTRLFREMAIQVIIWTAREKQVQ